MQVSEAALLTLFSWGTSLADTRAQDTALTDQIVQGVWHAALHGRNTLVCPAISSPPVQCEHHELEEAVFSHVTSIAIRAWQALEAAAAAVAEATEELRYEAADLAEE